MHSARRFGLLDAMVLVAAISLAVALMRYTSAKDLRFRIDPSDDQIQRLVYYVFDVTYHGCELCFCLALALMLLAARPPRPLLAEYVSHAGGSAVVTATAVVVTSIILYAPSLYIVLRNPDPFFPSIELRFSEELSILRWSTGPFIAAVWLIQALSRNWRTQAHWIDRSGRVIGGFFIVLSLSNCVVQNMHKIHLTIMQGAQSTVPASQLPPLPPSAFQKTLPDLPALPPDESPFETIKVEPKADQKP